MEFGLSEILNLVLGALALFLGVKFNTIKGKIMQVFLLGKESLELVEAVVKAIEDNKITPEEMANIKKQAQDVKEAWRKLLGKKI